MADMQNVSSPRTGELDELRLAQRVAVGLPLATTACAAVVAVTLGAPMTILVLAAGILLGVIALFWASLRVLTGDAPLPPELEALDARTHSVDALASRKKMLIRALKDLDNERALGKLEEEDYVLLSQRSRAELKDVLTKIDATVAPYREQAEEAARAYLESTEIHAATTDAESETETETETETSEARAKTEDRPVTPARRECPKCAVSNEPDATFCKRCGGTLTPSFSPPPRFQRGEEE